MKYIIIFFTTFLFASNLIVQYPNIKPYYYKNQIINLNIKIITPTDKNLTFIAPLNSELNATKTNPFTYLINLKYKNNNKTKTLFILGKNTYKQIELNKLYKTKTLEKINNFCGILAKNLKIINTISSAYNKNRNMISFTLVGKNANLNDFYLPDLKDENLTLVNNNKATFFATLDKNTTSLNFYYFNTDTDNFNKITIPVKIQEQTISTQTELTPEENTLFTPINLLLLLIIAFLIIIFLVYQKVILLIPPILLSAYLVYTNLPKGEMVLPRGTKVYILPTRNSTVFYIAPLDTKAKILKKLHGYIKIKFNNKIGWIKNENS